MIANSPTTSTDPNNRLSRRADRRRRADTFHPAYRPHAIEVAIKLGMNVLFITGCIMALIHLLPQIRNQHRELQEIQAETTVTRTRVEHLQADFNRYFDPQQAKSVMQEQGHRIDPSQRRVVFVEPSPSPSAEAAILGAD
ncbi:slr1601 family putative cell division protein [Trichothermofontia sp.]